MNRAEREILIERYMSAEMSSAEESDFFIQVALDRELRQELKAQRVIESSLRKDLESEPTEHTGMRARVASMLAASSNSPMRAAMPMAGPVPRSGPTEKKRSRWGLVPLQWMIASGVALALTAGTAIVLPSGKSDIPPARVIFESPAAKVVQGIGTFSPLVPSASAGKLAANTSVPVKQLEASVGHSAPGTGSIVRDSRPAHSGIPAGMIADRGSLNTSSRPASRERRNVGNDFQSPKREEILAPVRPPANDGPINVGVTIEVQKKKIE